MNRYTDEVDFLKQELLAVYEAINLAILELGHICHADAEHNPRANAAHQILCDLRDTTDRRVDWNVRQKVQEARHRLEDRGINLP